MSAKIIFDPHRVTNKVRQYMQEHYDVEFIETQDIWQRYQLSPSTWTINQAEHIHLFDKQLRALPQWLRALQPTLEEKINQNITAFMDNYGPAIIAMDNFIQNERPSLIIQWNDVSPASKALTILGQRYNIPSLHVNHGIPDDVPVHHKIWADKIAVYGTRTRDLYIRWGNPSDKIIVTGNPLWDEWIPISTEESQQQVEELGLDKDKIRLLYAPTWYHKFNNLADPERCEINDIKTLIDSLLNLKNSDKFELIIKIHPGQEQKASMYRQLLSESTLSFKVFNNISALPLIQVADAVICSGTMIYEAALLNKAVLVYRLDQSMVTSSSPLLSENDQYLAQNGPAIIIREPRDLQVALKKLAEGAPIIPQRDYSKFIRAIGADQDGCATKRVATAAMGMLKKHPSNTDFVSPANLPKPKDTYYKNARKDIPAMISGNPEKILEIGCASGAMGQHVKTKFNCEYTGIEVVPEYAREAATKLDRVIEADIEKADLNNFGLEDKTFDYIIMGDVLEHLYDPWSLIYRCKSLLKDDGQILASIPNIRHFSVINMLASGNWTYQSEGIMDSTHLRFFTLAEIKKAFSKAGYTITEIVPLQSNGVDLNQIQDKNNIDFPCITLKNMSRNDVIELTTVQFVIRARKMVALPSISIIIVTYNSLLDIKDCLESIRNNTTYPHEVIIIDNASSDGTSEFIANQQDVKGILNETNNGFSKASNQGIDASSGDYILLLNPDTVVTPNWDKLMIDHFREDVGAVGPISNYVAGLQRMELHFKEKITGTLSIEEIAQKVASWNYGQGLESKLLIGFCMMIPRQVIERLGMLDESLFLGSDDLEYSLRLRLNGYKLIIATDSFIFHKGQASFNSEPSMKMKKLTQDSQDCLYSKLESIYGEHKVPDPMELWGIDWFKPSNRQPALTSIIILTFNQLEYTRICVHSIVNYTSEPHEIIIIDNGSTDGSVAFLQDFAATNPNVKLILNEENRGFAGGNNQGIQAATGEYILFLNNDTVVTQGWLRRLIGAIENEPKIGMAGPMSNEVSGPQLVSNAQYADLDQMQTFANELSAANIDIIVPVIRLVGFCMVVKREVIELIGGFDEEYAIGNFEDDDFCLRVALAGYTAVIAQDVFVHHFGSQTFKGNNINYDSSLDKNRARFCAKWPDVVSFPPDQNCYAINVTANKQSVFLNNLGEEAFMAGDYIRALKLFERILKLDPNDSQALNNLGVIQTQMGNPASGIELFTKVLKRNPANQDALANIKDAMSVAGIDAVTANDLIEKLMLANRN